MKKFVYSGYWGTWSRTLATPKEGGNFYFIEVNLTPINHIDWENRVIPIIIRKHCTIRRNGKYDCPQDKETNVLPDHVLEEMKKHLDEELINRLLNEDFLSQIDWEKYERHCNGGAPLHKIQKEV